MSIPTLVPRDLLPRPEWTALRILVTTIIPVLLVFAVLVRGAPVQQVLVGLLMIGSQVSLAVTQAQKELLAVTTSYFRPGLGRRIGQAQLFWGLSVPALTTAVYGALAADAGAALLGSIFGLAMLVHALMAWATFRLWWAFQLPAWAFYFFWVPLVIRKAGAAGWVPEAARYPAAWLAAGAVALALLVRYAASRGLQRHLHDTIVLGPEAIFSPGRIQAHKRHNRRHAHVDGGVAWRSRVLGRLVGRAGAACRRGNAAGTRHWQILAADFALNTNPRPVATPLLLLGLLAATVVFGYLDSTRSLGAAWYQGILYQAGLAPVFSLAVVLLGAPLNGVSRRAGLRSEATAFLGATLAATAAAVLLKLVTEALAGVLPPVTWSGAERTFTPAPWHGLWLVPLCTPFAWLAVALRPRPHCTLSNLFVIAGFFCGHGVMSRLPYAQSAPIFGAVSAVVFALAFWLRRRWWLRADLPC